MMKKVETKFVCDDCGQELPNEYIETNSKGCVFFNANKYNTAILPINSDADIKIEIDLTVKYDYGPTLMDLCPACRTKWILKAIKYFEKDLVDQ
ncbi:hypothetical protein WGC32_14325 [Zongyangia sp. HA2173]|uniref:hypothetical protein n=1 Tax=Zongyangia sp. HA2173 TaxID=3133035 RepID=UPI00315EB5A7